LFGLNPDFLRDLRDDFLHGDETGQLWHWLNGSQAA
jgi:hypothetical protein